MYYVSFYQSFTIFLINISTSLHLLNSKRTGDLNVTNFLWKKIIFNKKCSNFKNSIYISRLSYNIRRNFYVVTRFIANVPSKYHRFSRIFRISRQISIIWLDDSFRK